ncbi:NAD(P)/FAD-dependent oxidoreductase [Methylotuvimicrobium sp. KM1]|uniref:NAD(P)/FAD-dependent oxidoreductase n=1 Tax=Methylotuvimicrobium sp. KM1 TaxID=3377707 RepID=UPI00384F1E08
MNTTSTHNTIDSSETQGSQPLHVVIVGGGYAGLSALITLRKASPDARITLIDPKPWHLIITRLHETIHRPLESIRIPYKTLAERFQFDHRQYAVDINENRLKDWQDQRAIKTDTEILPFDFMLITTGASSGTPLRRPNFYDLTALTLNSGAEILERFVSNGGPEKTINLIGGGPTGIQFAFEIDHVLKAMHVEFRLNVYDAHAKLLGRFPHAFGDYVEQRMIEKRIAFMPEWHFESSAEQTACLVQKQGERREISDSQLTLLLTGKKPQTLWHANSSGQIRLDKETLTRIFTAGDCSHYDMMGSNSMTAQSALRKGRAAAKNILLEAGLTRFCLPYMHRDIGYVLSLGPSDAVGWVGTPGNIVKGVPAYLIKETTEMQYDLLLSGVDSYIG